MPLTQPGRQAAAAFQTSYFQPTDLDQLKEWLELMESEVFIAKNPSEGTVQIAGFCDLPSNRRLTDAELEAHQVESDATLADIGEILDFISELLEKARPGQFIGFQQVGYERIGEFYGNTWVYNTEGTLLHESKIEPLNLVMKDL